MKIEQKEIVKVVLALIVGVAAVAACWQIARGLQNFRRGENKIQVTGMAEKQITSDLIVWNITVSGKAFNKSEAYAEFDRSNRQVRKYLRDCQIPDSCIEANSVSIDKQTRSEYDSSSERYIEIDDGYAVTQNIAVSSRNLPIIEKAYQKNKSRYNVPGFRKGKATKKMIEKAYGSQVFYDAALNEVLDRHYPEAAEESGLDIVSRPEIDIVEIGEGKDLIFTATVAVRPEVKLGEYFGVEAEKADVSVTAKEVTERLNRELEKNSRMIDVDRAIKKNDIASIDFVGSVEGKEFAGGKGEDYPLTIGSGTFIPGFEEQLIGAKAGDHVDVKVTFPENYGAKDLAGKEALFKVTVKGVKEKQVPKADDEFASEVSEFDTLDEFKKDLKKQIKEEKEKRATSEVENNVIAKVVENATVELPEPMVATQLDQMFYDYGRRMEQQGIPMEQYMQITGLTPAALKEQMRESAIANIKNSLVLDAIQKKEGIEVSEEKLEEELQRISDQYRMKKEDFVKTITDSQKESIKRELNIQATIDALVSKAKLVKPEKKSKKEEKAEKEEA